MSKQKISQKGVAADTYDLRIYRLKITLAYTDPAIWRGLEVYAQMEMDSLATAIDTVFGWSGEHMSAFDIKGRTIGDDNEWQLTDPNLVKKDFYQRAKLLAGFLKPQKSLLPDLEPEFLETDGSEEEGETGAPVLCEIVPRVRTKFTYTYDFGDDWKHLIEVEKIAPAEPGVRYPRCTSGARANPIEDCGGPWGFSEWVAAAGNPKHERFADLEEWGLARWDPAKFSVDQVNRKLARLFRLKK